MVNLTEALKALHDSDVIRDGVFKAMNDTSDYALTGPSDEARIGTFLTFLQGKDGTTEFFDFGTAAFDDHDNVRLYYAAAALTLIAPELINGKRMKQAEAYFNRTGVTRLIPAKAFLPS